MDETDRGVLGELPTLPPVQWDNVYLIAALWLGLALIASLISIRTGISVALVEIGVGVLAGNFLHVQTNAWIDRNSPPQASGLQPQS